MSENLEVFGYSSKIFRDDAAATHIDEEKHMHPHELDLLTTIDRWVIFKEFFEENYRFL